MENSKEKKKNNKKRDWLFSKKKKTKVLKEDSRKAPEIHDIKELLEFKQINLKPRINRNKVSKLCPPLLDILKKSVALGYFHEYLEEVDKKHFLDFWLEAETFRLITEKRYIRKSRSNSSLSCNGKSISYESKDSLPEESIDSCFSSSLSEDINIVERNENATKNNMIIERTHHEHDTMNDSLSNFKQRSSSLQSFSTKEEFRERARTKSVIVDAVTIYSKYISLNADFPINLPSTIRNNIEAVICKDRNYLDPTCFVVAQEYILDLLLKPYEDFLRTSSMVSHQLKLLESGKILLEDVLYHDSILFYFTEFLDQENCKKILEFYMTAENFEEDTEAKLADGSYDIDNAVNDAMHIYEKYFSMRCECQLIKDDKLRIVLENNICREDGPQPNCFCIPMAYAWTALSEIYLPAFTCSEVYKSYLSHLKSTVSSGDEMKSCSSRSSMHSHDDFPLLSHADSKLSILEDENGLEEFWFKPIHHQSTNRLALGHVNEYGVFNSEIEKQFSDNSSNSVSKFGKAMKNLIRGETNEETEQLAWQRAIKIIEEIQQQTQPQ